MNEPQSCPRCAAPLPADSPAGLCPKCLLQAGFESAPASGDPAASPTVKSPAGSRAGFDPPSAAELAPLFPQLEILELLGQGGMGAVYKARQPGLDRLVAVKILPPEISRSPAFAERFAREAKALAKLNHPHIVAVYDFGQAAGPRASATGAVAGPLCYFLMEYVDGVNLRQALQSGHVDPQTALAIVPQICEALQFAHDEGVVHRDIKPENILIDKRGRVKIADFGLAKLMTSGAPGGSRPHDLSLTGTQQVMGTLRYMAPEQMEGAKSVDHRADIYSLGVVFYELLTGEVPMGRFAPPSKKVQIDVRLDEIVLRALEREPEQRYQHASDVKTDVESVTDRAPEAVRDSPRDFMKSITTSSTVGTLGPDLNGIQRQLEGPAIGLLFAGALAILSTAINFFHLVINHGRSQADGPFGNGTPLVLTIWCAGCLVAVPVMILAALKMRRLQNYGLAVAAGVLALFPCAWSFPVSLLIGIWTLVVLTRPDVKAAFRRATKTKADGPTTRGTDEKMSRGQSSRGAEVLAEPATVDADSQQSPASAGTETGEQPARGAPPGTTVLRRRWFAAATAVVLAAAAVAVVVCLPTRAQPIIYPLYGDTGFVQGANGPELGAGLIAKLGVPPAQVAAANRVFQTYYDKYVALERRHTKYTRDAQGKVYITIDPFVNEMHELATDLQAELGGIVDLRIAPSLPEKGKVHQSLPIFRQAGEAWVHVELWKDVDGSYDLSSVVEWEGGGGNAFSSSGAGAYTFPAELRLYWTEPDGAAAPAGGGVSTPAELAAAYREAHNRKDVAAATKLFFIAGVPGVDETWLRDQIARGFERPARKVEFKFVPGEAWLSKLAVPPKLVMIGELSVELEDPRPAPPVFTSGFRYLVGRLDNAHFLVAEVLKGIEPPGPRQ